MEQMLLRKKTQLKKNATSPKSVPKPAAAAPAANANPNPMPQPSANDPPIRDDDPFQGLQPALNINQVPRNNNDLDDYQPLKNTTNASSGAKRGIKYGSSQLGNNQISMRSTTTATWIQQQEKAFTGWVNAHLQTRQMFVNTLQGDIATVSPLIHLLEILEKGPIKEITKYHKKPRHKFDRLDGMRICLKQIRSRGRKNIKVGFDAEVLLKGQNKKVYLALIWRIIINYAIENTTAEEILDNKKRAFKTPQARLRWWCNARLPDDLKVTNFTTNWSDGKVLVNLINQALDENDRITQDDIDDLDTQELLEGIFKLGDKHLHIPQLLDPYEIMHNPNKEAVMTYVSLLRTAIESKEAERSAASASMKKMKDAFQNLEANWLDRVKILEGRLDDAQKQQNEYAEKLQDERQLNAQQLHDAKNKTDKLFAEIEKLKALCLDQQHEKEMMQNDYNDAMRKQKQEITRLKQQLLTLQAQNDNLNDQLSDVLNQNKSAQTGNAQQISAYEMQIGNLQSTKNQQKNEYENRIKELEDLMEAQRKKFNDFYEQYKKKLVQSNKAGREYREKCIVVAADTDALRKRISELESLLKIKEKELLDARKREKELLEQLATQETVFRIQLQELGQFIKEMKQREQLREKQQVEAYHKLLKEREQRIAKDKERKRKDKLNNRKKKDGGVALANVDLDAQRQMLQQFARRKSGGGNDPYMNKPAPPSGAPPAAYAAAAANANPLLSDNNMAQANKSGKPAFDKQTEAVRTKFGNEKIITTWFYTGRDGKVHEVILRHNTKSGKDHKSKRVIVVDGKVRYAEKSKETHFIIKNGKDQLKLNIQANNNKKGFNYRLFINDTPFGSLQNQYLQRFSK